MRPLGFVCADGDATVRLDDRIPRAFTVEPNRSRSLPYAFAVTRPGAQSYARVPAPPEPPREVTELARPLEVAPQPAPAAARSPVGAKSAPPERDGLVSGPVSGSGAATSAGDAGVRAEQMPGLDAALEALNLAAPEVEPGRRAGVALLGTFVTPASDSRRFALTTDARLMPADDLELTPGSPFHGWSLEELSLPVALGGRADARFWALEGRRLEPRLRLEPRQLVQLTGVERVMGGARMLEARGGQWLRRDDLRILAMPGELPRFARGEQRWIDVCIADQTLVLWKGDRPVYATLVSIGEEGSGEAGRQRPAPGVFRILQKHVTRTVGAGEGSELALRDAPWVMTSDGGHLLYGAYWHDDFGRERARGGIELSPSDARRVFEWSLPDVPEHWHGAYAGDSFGDGTLLRIEP